ncbi:hypothetical protein ABT298_00460 [Streptomyces sp. NPDC001034]|uniref:Dyp-type peroxidase n=1 Tax=Streptomyces sp. NPDC001034 TaxID=3154375 RepID=UPI003334397B
MPSPDVLGRNGTCVAVRKVHTRVAAWRSYLRAHSSSAEEEALLAAKMVGRRPSGAPLTLSPEHDDPELAADPHRVNNFLHRENDDRGFRCPAGAHIRRTNPRDSTIIGDARMHRLIRRGTTYGPPLPEGVLEDDGADPDLIGAFIGANLERTTRPRGPRRAHPSLQRLAARRSRCATPYRSRPRRPGRCPSAGQQQPEEAEASISPAGSARRVRWPGGRRRGRRRWSGPAHRDMHRELDEQSTEI